MSIDLKKDLEYPARIYRYNDNHGKNWITFVVCNPDNKKKIVAYFSGTRMIDKEESTPTNTIYDCFNIHPRIRVGKVVRAQKEQINKAKANPVVRTTVSFFYIDKNGFKVCFDGIHRRFNKKHGDYNNVYSKSLRHLTTKSVREASEILAERHKNDPYRNGYYENMVYVLSQFKKDMKINDEEEEMEFEEKVMKNTPVDAVTFDYNSINSPE